MQAVAPLERVMKRFVIRQNIEHYRATLTVTTDSAQRVQIERLLHEEEAKLKKYATISRKTRPAPARQLDQSRFNSPGSLAKFAAKRRASSLASRLPRWTQCQQANSGYRTVGVFLCSTCTDF